MEIKTTTYEGTLLNDKISFLIDGLPWVIFNKGKSILELNTKCRALFSSNEGSSLEAFNKIKEELFRLFCKSITTDKLQFAIIGEKEFLYLPSETFEIDGVQGFIRYFFIDVQSATDAISQTSLVNKIWEYHNSVLNTMDDGIFITDAKGTVISVNDRALLGREPSSLIGFNMQDLYTQGICPEPVSMEAIKLKKTVTRFQYRHEDREILTTATPYFKDGKINIIVCCQRSVNELELVKKQLQEAEEINSRSEEELTYLRTLNSKENDNIVVESEIMKKVLAIALIAAKYDSTVLLEGESGVGKEMVADYLHANSHRSKNPFIKINCNAIPENLFESEFFGYERGAFSGANLTGRKGYFELSNHGILLLDEIGDIPLNMQAKLLRAIERKEIVKVGGDRAISLDVQIIATTNKSLADSVKAGSFRSDLYYRLNSFPITVPPLRKRRKDIKPLVNFFTRLNNQIYGLNKTFSDDALLLLERHEWVGNVRELENVVKRTFLTTCTDIIESIDILSVLISDESLPEIESESISFDNVIENFEKLLLLNYIRKYHNVNDLEKVLGISRSTLNRKLMKYDLRQYLNEIQ